MATISARSPFIIEINETGQISTRMNITIWNGTGAMPSSVSYAFSKVIPSSNEPTTYYDIAPYIREFLSHTTVPTNTSISTMNTSQWCNVYIDKWYTDDTSETYIGSGSWKAIDGYGEYEDGYNPDNGLFLLDEKTYYYNSGTYAGTISAYLTYTSFSNQDYAIYTNLVSGSSTTINASSTGFKTLPRVLSSYLTSGNVVNFYNGSDVLQKTFYFRPVTSCKYTPVTCDFINKYGAWQREFFFKASNDSLEVVSSDYNVMQSSYPDYSTTQGQKRSFNTNGKKSIKVNTDWVAEDFKDNLQQLMLSERILIDGKPAILKTKSTELFKHINQKMINYSLEFEFAYNVINNVI